MASNYSRGSPFWAAGMTMLAQWLVDLGTTAAAPVDGLIPTEGYD